MDKKSNNQNTGNARATNRSNKKDPRKKTSGKTRPDRPVGQKATPGRKSHDPGRVPRRPKSNPLDELFASEEFQADLRRISELLDKETEAGLTIGALAHKWIGDRRYSRVLNPVRFAEAFTKHTGRELSGEMVRYYIGAHKEHQFHQKCGKGFDNLGVGHLAAIAQSECKTDEDRLKLAELANERNAKVRQIKHLATRVHRKARQAARLLDVEPTRAHVQQMEALEFLRKLDDGKVECAILDWQWSPVKWGQHAEFPDVHCPEDPAGHLCECLELLHTKLAEVGLVFVFYSSVGFLDPRIKETCDRIGFKHAGKVIWQKSCGAFMDADTPVTVAHEEVHMLCHGHVSPKSPNGAISSVTPKWAAPTHAHSGKQGDAVHRFQKPVALMDRLISIATVNGLVADPFSGSGSAGIAAVRRGCSYAGAELIEEYVEIANKRIALATDETGQVLDAIDFFYQSATPEQDAAITAALEKSGMHVAKRGGES